MDEAKLLAELRFDEGSVNYEYKDSLGFSTIGVGRLIDKRKGGGLSDAEVDYLLANDVARTMADLDRAIAWWRTLDPVRQRVIVNMAFNLGVGNAAHGTGLLGFKNTLAKIVARDYAGAARNMLVSKWAKQVGDRAKRLATMMETGA